MGEKKGQDSGVTAQDLVRAPDIDRVKPTPGKGTIDRVGDAWIDHGSACDGKDSTAPGCFLDDWQRLKVIVDLKSRIETAATNYKLALAELRFEELLKKSDDLPWVLSLVLDLVGSHFVKTIGKAAVALKNAGVQKLASSLEGAYLSDRAWQSRTETVLRALDDKAIESHVKSTFDPLKKSGVAGVKTLATEQEADEKRQSTNYIDDLKDRSDVGFQGFAEAASARATDAELVVIRDGFDRANHTISQYKAALHDKLERFKKSGVTKLGRQLAIVDRFPHGTRLRDTRVVWLQQNGKKTLHYQAQDSAFLTQSRDPHGKFGPNYAAPAQIGDPVPDEFVDVALARSEQIWGTTPLILTPNMTAPPSAPATSVPTMVPDRKGPRSVEPNIDALPPAFHQVKVK